MLVSDELILACFLQAPLPLETTKLLGQSKSRALEKYKQACPVKAKQRLFEIFKQYLEILEDSEFERMINSCSDDRTLRDLLQGSQVLETGVLHLDDIIELTPEFVLARPHFAAWYQRVYLITMDLRSRIGLKAFKRGKSAVEAESSAKLRVWGPNSHLKSVDDDVQGQIVTQVADTCCHPSADCVAHSGGAEESKVFRIALFTCCVLMT